MTAAARPLLLLLLAGGASALQPMPTRWSLLSAGLKGSARRWFVRRAEAKGIPWRESAALAAARVREADVERAVDPSVAYPPYFLQPFHGYDEGNLDLQAAHEMQASTWSMSSGYWPDVDYLDAARYVRGNFTERVQRRIFPRTPHAVLDLGASTGISTRALAEAFPTAQVVGVDLSPHFVATARADATARTRFVHANAECLPAANHTYDLVCASYLMHEVPLGASWRILMECRRVLKPGGTLAIVDLDPARLRERLSSPFRRWAFEATEPHIYSYYSSDLGQFMADAGFTRVVKDENDPLNAVWLGTAPRYSDMYCHAIRQRSSA